MQAHSDQPNSEQTWREGTSAGQATQRLSAPEIIPSNLPATPYRPTGTSRSNGKLGLALIAIGALLLVGRLLAGADVQAGLFFLTIASGFLFFAFWRRIYGLLIPGCILAGLSLGVTFANITNGVLFFWGLALGFLSLYLVGRSLFRVSNPWPLYPAVALLGVGTLVGAAMLPAIFVNWLVLLPLLLIGGGLYLGWGRATR